MNRTYSTALLSVAFFASVLLLVLGCSSSDKGTPPPPFDVEANIAQGWQRFASGDYEGGLGLFSAVLKHSENHPGAFLGKGWCFAFTGDLDSAIVMLRAAITHSVQGLYTVDANMGLAAVIRDCLSYPDNFKEAVERAEAVLKANSSYVFAMRPSINYKDAHLIVAQCHFRRGSAYFRYAHPVVNYLCTLEGLDLLPEAESIPPAEYERLMADRLHTLSGLISD